MDRSRLHHLLPHQGQALWLEQILEHDASSIRGLGDWDCLSPYGADASPCLLFEAAAQLCAAHGALYSGDKSIDMALLGKLSSLELHSVPAQRSGALLLEAEQLAVSPAGASYHFAIHSQEHLLLDGQLLLVLQHA